MDYIQLQTKYPVLANVVACHFSEEFTWEIPSEDLEAQRAAHFVDGSEAARRALRAEVAGILQANQAKELLANERLFVKEFASETEAQHFIVEGIWKLYFPEEALPE